jgi:hypothetical protein
VVRLGKTKFAEYTGRLEFASSAPLLSTSGAGLQARVGVLFSFERSLNLPRIFQGICKDCGYESGQWSDRNIAVLLGRDNAALSLAVNQVPASGDTGGLCLFVLPHPGEHRALERTGLTLDGATRLGRMVRLTTVVCRECGATYQRRRLCTSIGSTGCMIGLGASLISGIGAGVCRRSFEVGVLAFCGVMVLATAVIELIEWCLLQRFRARAWALRRARNCPKCGSDWAQAICRYRLVPCPNCKRRRVRFRMVARS